MLDKLTAEGNLDNDPWQGDCCDLGKQDGSGELSQENEWGESSQGGGWDQVNCDPPWEGGYCETQDETSQGGGWNQVNCDPPWEGEYCEAQDKTYQGGELNQVNSDPSWEGENCGARDENFLEREWVAPSQGEGWDQSTQVICDPPWNGDCEPGDKPPQEQGLGKPPQEEAGQSSQIECKEVCKDVEAGEATAEPAVTSEWSDGWSMP